MIARTALDTNVLTDLSLDGRQAIAATESFLRYLRKHGILCSDRSRGDLLKMALSMETPRLRELWSEAIRVLPQCPVVGARADFTEYKDLGEVVEEWSAHAELAVLEDTWSEVVGLAHDAVSWSSDSPLFEVVALTCAAEARTFVRLSALAERPVGSTERREVVWSDRLLPLATHARTATICCRYSGKELLRRGSACGLAWLLGKLRSVGPADVDVITAFGIGEGTDRVGYEALRDAFDQFAAGLPSGRLKHLRVGLVLDKDFRDSGHDRFIRFRPHGDHSPHQVVELGRGLAVFRNEAAGQESAFHYLVQVGQPERETALRGLIDKWLEYAL